MLASDFAVQEKALSLPWRLPIRHFSASSVIEAASCPEKWRRNKILGEKQRATSSLVVGSAVHGALATYMDEKRVKGSDLSQPEVQQAYMESWDKVVRKEGGIDGVDWGETSYADSQSKGLALTHLYAETVAKRVQPLAVEQRFHSRIIPGIPVPMLGFIDLVTEGTMVDYKTASRKFTTPKGAYVIQARVYQMVRPLTFDWHVLVKTASPSIVTPLDAPSLSLPYNEVAVQQVRRYVRDLVWTLNYHYLTLGAENPWPTTGYVDDSCRFCSFRETCSAWRR